MITIHQEPSTPNEANTDLVYVVSSNNNLNPLFQYVMEIQDESKDRLVTVKQQPNPVGSGVFNIGNILPSYMYSEPVGKTTFFQLGVDDVKEFNIAFGEEYGTSLSSSVTQYTGTTTTVGSPAKSGSLPLTVYNGLVDYSFDLDTTNLFVKKTTSTSDAFSLQHALSNSPVTHSVQDTEYHTLSIINGNFDEDQDAAQDIYYIQVNVNDVNHNNIQNFGYYNFIGNQGGPRPSQVEEWYQVVGQQTPMSKLLHIGTGPKNFQLQGNTLNTNWEYYIVTAHPQESQGIENNQAYFFQHRFNKQSKECSYNGVRFTWRNKLGGWDYYTATLANTQENTIERNTYTKSNVSYSTSITSAQYNAAEKKISQYLNKIETQSTVQTNYLTQQQADWLKELFFTTDVYMQVEDEFIPVSITTASVTEKTNSRSQKLFSYVFEYKLSNQPRSRR